MCQPSLRVASDAPPQSSGEPAWFGGLDTEGMNGFSNLAEWANQNEGLLQALAMVAGAAVVAASVVGPRLNRLRRGSRPTPEPADDSSAALESGEGSTAHSARPVQPGPAGDAPPKADLATDERPSIAVLPFDNMSGDPDQEFFSDGLTEDIITELCRFRELFVIARNSTFTYKGKATRVSEVGRDLGVQYVVEGSVQRAGNRVRVTVQLLEVASGSHIWAERYDRDLSDLFEVQDQVTQAIVATLPGRLEAAALDRSKRKPPANMAAYDYLIRGKILHHRGTPEDNAEALRVLDRAIALDPDYAQAYAWKACTLGQAASRGFLTGPSVMETAVEAVRTAYELDADDSEVHRLLAGVSLVRKDFEKASYHQARGLTLNPNYDLLVVQNGEVLTWRGHASEGIEWIQRAMQLNPYHPQRFWSHLGRALYQDRRYQDALESFQKITAPDYTHLSFLAACRAQLGYLDAARSDAAATLAAKPDFSVDAYLDGLPYEHDADRAHHREGLLKAGLPAG